MKKKHKIAELENQVVLLEGQLRKLKSDTDMIITAQAQQLRANHDYAVGVIKTADLAVELAWRILSKAEGYENVQEDAMRAMITYRNMRGVVVPPQGSRLN